MSGKQCFGSALAVTIVVALCWSIFFRGYGEVSQPTYDFALALYGACLAKNETRIDKIELAILAVGKGDSKGMGNVIPSREITWLHRIIAKARNAQWESAAREAQQIMEAQVGR